MTTTPEPEQPNQAKDEGALKKGFKVVTAKKNRGYVIAAIVFLIALASVVFSVLPGEEDDQGEVNGGPVEVEIPTDGTTEEPVDEGETTDEPTVEEGTPAPEPSETAITQEPEPEPEPEPSETEEEVEEGLTERAQPDAPKDRGGLPDEFPLPDSYTHASTEEEDGRVVINGTVSDSKEAITLLDHNLGQHYMTQLRNLDPNKASGRYDIEGPGMEDGAVVIVSTDGTLQVRISTD